MNRPNKACVVNVISQCASQLGNKARQISLHNERVGPQMLVKLLFGRDLRPAQQQNGQQIDRFRREMDHCAPLEELTCAQIEGEPVELKLARGHGAQNLPQTGVILVASVWNPRIQRNPESVADLSNDSIGHLS